MTPADGAVTGERYVNEDDARGHPVRRHLPVIAEVGSKGRPKRTGARPSTLSMRRQSKRALERDAALHPTPDVERPKTRGDCLPGGCNEARPCPWVSCAAHLALSVGGAFGSIKVTHPDASGEPDLDAMTETCALDVADRGGITLEQTAAMMNLTRERIRQLEDLSLARLKATRAAADLVDHLDSATPGPSGDLRARIVGIRHTPDVMPRSYR